MRNVTFIAILLCGLCSTCHVNAQVFATEGMAAREKAAQQASPDRDASTAIRSRVHAGDKQALSELAGMDPVVAIPILAQYAKNRSTDAERAAIALATLKKVRGVRDYFRARIAYLRARDSGDFDAVSEFRTLSLIGTKEAVAAAAPSLFDNTEFKNQESDVGVDSLRYQALCSLLRMNLADAPTKTPVDDVNEDDIQKWRAWWTAHKAEYEN